VVALEAIQLASRTTASDHSAPGGRARTPEDVAFTTYSAASSTAIAAVLLRGRRRAFFIYVNRVHTRVASQATSAQSTVALWPLWRELSQLPLPLPLQIQMVTLLPMLVIMTHASNWLWKVKNCAKGEIVEMV